MIISLIWPFLCSPRWWSLWKRWQARSTWDSTMPRECTVKCIRGYFMLIYPCSAHTDCPFHCPVALLMLQYWPILSPVSGSSQKKKRATEILPSDTTWKRRRSVTECWNMWDFKCFLVSVASVWDRTVLHSQVLKFFVFILRLICHLFSLLIDESLSL